MAIVVVVLTLGITANVVVFRLVDAVMLRPLPVENPEQLVMFRWIAPESFSKKIKWSGVNGQVFSWPTYQFLRDRNGVLSNLFGSAEVGTASGEILAKLNGKSRFMRGVVVTGNYFDGLGIRAAAGRLLTSHDNAGSAPVVVISYDLWTQEFDRRPSAIGQTLSLNDLSYTIIGVAPAGFFGLQPGTNPDFWEPIDQWEKMKPTMATMYFDRTSPSAWWLTLMGRLKPGIDRQQAFSELQALFQSSFVSQLGLREQAFPRLVLEPGGRGLNKLRDQFSYSLVPSMGLVVLVLLLACANVAALMLIRLRTRTREVAVRLALGAPRSDINQQLFIEILMLVISAGILGFVFAFWGTRALASMLSGFVEPMGMRIAPGYTDVMVLCFGIGVVVLVAVLCWMVPAWLAVRVDLSRALRSGDEHLTSSSGWADKVLLVAQVAVSLQVLIGAGLFIRTLRNLTNQDLGFGQHNLVFFAVDATKDGYKDVALVNFYERLVERVQALPATTSATCSTVIPVSPWMQRVQVAFEDYPPEPGSTPPMLEFNMVGPRFFETMGIQILQGRGLEWSDLRGTHNVAVINAALARQFFAKTSAIGRHFSFGGRVVPGSSFEIVGIVENTKYGAVTADASPTIYIPFSQLPGVLSKTPLGMHFELRTRSALAPLLPAIQNVVLELDRNLPLADVETGDKQLASALTQQRLLAELSGSLGLLVLFLVCISSYAIGSHMVTRRIREIAIRIAMGASRTQVLRMVLRQLGLLAGIGTAIGFSVALGTTRLIANQLYGVKPADPETVIVAVLLIITAYLAGGYIPAKRATQVDPAVALRFE